MGYETLTPDHAAFSEEQADQLIADLARTLSIDARKENLRVGGEPTCHWSVLVLSSVVKRAPRALSGFVLGWRVGKGLL